MPVFDDPHFPKPGTKPTFRPPSTRPSLDQAALVRQPQAARAATQTVPLKSTPGGLKLADIQPPRLPVMGNAAVYEPYNPYPPRKRQAAQMMNPLRSSLTTWGLVSTVVALIVAGGLFISTFFVQTYAEKQIAKAVQKAAAPYESSAAFSFSGVKVSLFSQTVSLKDVKIELAETDKHPAETVTIDRLSVWGLDWKTLRQIATTRKASIPETMNFAANGVHLSTDFLGQQAQVVLQSMGYTDLVFSFSGETALRQHSLDLKNFDINIENVGEIGASLSLGHLTMPTSAEIARLKNDPKLLLTESGDFTKATLRGFEFSFRDASFVKRASEALVRMGETAPVDLALMALDVNSRNPASADSDFVRPSLETLARFLQAPRSISLSAHPATEVPILSLFDDSSVHSVNDLAHKLNMTLR